MTAYDNHGMDVRSRSSSQQFLAPPGDDDDDHSSKMMFANVRHSFCYADPVTSRGKLIQVRGSDNMLPEAESSGRNCSICTQRNKT